MQYRGPLLPKMVLRSGILCRTEMPLDVANRALDELAADGTPTALFEPRLVRPLSEPCVRVPLSLLRELRGQEPSTDRQRIALVRAWGDDRKTGTAVD
jgi:hypothetical protein